MTTPITGIGAITLRTMRAKLDEAAEGLAADGQPRRGLMMALDVEPLSLEANSLLQDWRSNGRGGLNCAAGFFPP
jgi:hypothetical protein